MNNDKKFGVWMDNYNAAIVGPDEDQTNSIMFLAHVTGEQSTQSASEKNTNNQERMTQPLAMMKVGSKKVKRMMSIIPRVQALKTLAYSRIPLKIFLNS